MALVIAVGVNQQGEREILGFDVGMSEDGAFWGSKGAAIKKILMRNVLSQVPKHYQGMVSSIIRTIFAPE